MGIDSSGMSRRWVRRYGPASATSFHSSREWRSLGCMDLVVRSRRVVLPEGVRPAAVAIAGGTIAAVASPDEAFPGAQEIGAGEAVVMPGLVDSHVHVDDPGRAEWEGFETAGRAAAAGGTTTIVDMPLNSVPPTTILSALAAKVAAASGTCRVDFGHDGQ